MDNHAKLVNLTIGYVSFTERELSLLACMVTEMIQSGLDPYREEYVIEVESLADSLIVSVSAIVSTDFLCFQFTINFESLSIPFFLRTRVSVARLTPDQTLVWFAAFSQRASTLSPSAGLTWEPRSTLILQIHSFHFSIPKWSWSWCGQEKARLQGVGPAEFQRYGMDALSDRSLSDFCGNSFVGCNGLQLLISLQEHDPKLDFICLSFSWGFLARSACLGSWRPSVCWKADVECS